MSPNNIFWRSRFFDNNARIFKSEGKCLEMINFASSFRAKKIMINDVLKYSSSTGWQKIKNKILRYGSSSDCSGSGYYSTALQYLYNIYKRQVWGFVIDSVRHGSSCCCSSCRYDIQYLYNIYRRQAFKPFSKWFFWKTNLSSDLHHKF